jgi:hypothetical protein
MKAQTKAWIGLGAWSAFVLGRVPDLGGESWATALLLFAALVLVPLALSLWEEEGETGAARQLFGFVRALQLPAALLLAGASLMAPGVLALVVALPWIGWTALAAVIGVMRIRRDGLRRPLDRLCADAALVFVAIGGAWTLAERVGYSPLGFSRPIVALTAVHFHYAGLLLPLFAGLVQRELWFWRFAARAAVGVVLGVPAVAVGITATQLGWGTSVEAAAGCGLAFAGMAVAILHVRIALETKRAGLTRALLAVSGVSLFFGMVLAALYATRASAALLPWLGLPQMRMLHGTINAVGFGLCGVLAWRRMGAEPVEPR